MISIGSVDRRTLVLGGVGLLVAGAAAGWFLYGEQLLEPSPPPPPPVAKAPAKPAPPPPPAAAAPAPKPAAPAVAADPDQVVAEIMSRSGMNAFAENFRQSALQGMEAAPNRPASLTPQVAQAYRDAINRVLAPAKITDQIRAQVRKSYDPAQAPRFLELLKQPINEKMTKLESEMPTPEQIRPFFENLRKSPLSPERQELIRRVDAAGRASEIAAEMSVVVIRGMIEGAVVAQPAGEAQAAAPANIEQQLAPMLQTVRLQTRSLLAFTYRNASEAELKEYAALLESESGRWGTNMLANAAKSVIDGAARELGAEMARISAEHRKTVQAATEQAPVKEQVAEVAQEAKPEPPKPEPAEPQASRERPKPPPPEKPLGHVDPTEAEQRERAAAEARRRERLPQVYSRYNDLVTAVTMQDRGAAHELLADGKSPDARATSGFTALMIAVQLGDLKMAELLLSRGADPNLRAGEGVTALQLAKRHQEMAGLLARYGARE